MRSKPAAGKVESLALAVAVGQTVRAWCKANATPERTAYAWAAKDSFKARVRALQAELVRQALARLTGGADAAAVTLRLLLKSESDKVKLGAARAIVAALIDLQTFSDLSARIEELERKLDEKH